MLLSNYPIIWQCNYVATDLINVILIEMTTNGLLSQNGYLAFYAEPPNNESNSHVYTQLHTGLIIYKTAIWAVPVVWYPEGLASSARNICHRLNWI